MFKINLFYPIEYRRRIRNYLTLKMRVKVIWNQWHLKTIKWAISDSLWIGESNRRSICNFTLHWLYLPLPICINCRALAWEGVYVYKLAFFFWLSPRTYHFLFEKRLIIDWRYFWQNIALSLILKRSPDYPLKSNDIDSGFTFSHLTSWPPWGPRGLSRECVLRIPECRKRRLNRAVSRNNRIKRVAQCRCLDGHVKEPYKMSMALGVQP